MASNYIPQGSYKDVQVLSPTAVIDVMVLTALTLPSHIYYEVYVPLDAFKVGAGPEYLSTTADGLERLNGHTGVTGVHFTTSLDSSGLVGQYAVATITIPTPKGSSGPFSAEVQFSLAILAVDPQIYQLIVTPQLAAAVAELEALAASGGGNAPAPSTAAA